MPWSHRDVPDQSGRTLVVTGANSGIGFEAAATLAAAGAHVVLACRDPVRAGEAAAQLRTRHPGASLETLPLDLASLASVRDFAKAFGDRHARLDVLVNNAGVMAIPRRTTADGFEMQLGTNHLGHFALTGLLLPLLLATAGARVVTVSSTAHRPGRMHWDDLQSERSYSRWGAYGQSKLANLLFTFELDRRARAAGRDLVAVACHPGYAGTNLQFVGARMDGSRWMESLMRWANRVFAQDAAMGALPTLYAATAPDVRGGDYYGPDGMFEAWGHPKKVASSARSRDREAARRLWEISEELTGVRYPALAREA
jgi:NAD(P)-dependent dehydrogenase (short-subunit alcohol dehydrogenase family)